MNVGLPAKTHGSYQEHSKTTEFGSEYDIIKVSRHGRFVSMERFLDPRNDWMFKKTFGSMPNNDILIDFLNAVFKGERAPIESITFLPTHQDPEIASLRQTFVDVRCMDVNKNQFIVEMQHYGDSFFMQRACVYASRAYIEQVKVSGPGEDQNEKKRSVYSDVKPIIFLAILDSFSAIEGDDYVSHNAFLDKKTFKCNIKEFSFSFIRLDKFHKSFGESQSVLDKWCYFFKNAQTTKAEDIAKMKDLYPLVNKAYDVLKRSNYTEEEYQAYCHAEMSADAYESCINSAREEGNVEGKKEGIKETARSMLAEGMSPEAVSRYTKLPIEEVLSILE
ncbi:MAG: Rpn family recombination-promoting nuclease/putative transposase [Holosporales bacterium]|jgi:predicted transposase/invertase (TIGR01784 family)|nr:Rpn family recombination-promoting nuclease/putative transposase [Holosporales bacterium]